MTGLHLAHYRIDAELGRGGMGIVYRAFDTKLDRTVALKVLPASALASEDDRARFFREAKAAAQLSHAHVCHVYEVGEAAPHKPGAAPAEGAELRPFIAMEFVDGESLAARIAHGPLKLEEAVRLASEIASALGAAHDAGIVHRDVKSGNVMLTAKGEAKVLDFGLAQTNASTKLTRQGSTVGTVSYMSPEQARGEEVDRRTDLWSLGVVLYEMLAGRLPFKADYEQAVLYSILNEDPEPLTAVRTGVPMELEAIVEKLLRKEAGQRYQTAADVVADLVHVAAVRRKADPSMSRTESAAASSAAPGFRRAGRRMWIWLPTAIAACVLLVNFLARDTAKEEFRRLPLHIAGIQYAFFPQLDDDERLLFYWGVDTTGAAGVWTTDLVTGDQTQLINSDVGPIGIGFQVAGGGSAIVFHQNDHLWVKALPNGQPRQISAEPMNWQMMSSASGEVVGISADMRRIVLLSASSDGPRNLVTLDTVAFPTGYFGFAGPRGFDERRGRFLYAVESTGEFQPQLYTFDLRSEKSYALHDGGISGQFIGSRHVMYQPQDGQALSVSEIDRDGSRLTGEPRDLFAAMDAIRITGTRSGHLLIAEPRSQQIEINTWSIEGTILGQTWLASPFLNRSAMSLSPDGTSMAVVVTRGSQQNYSATDVQVVGVGRSPDEEDEPDGPSTVDGTRGTKECVGWDPTGRAVTYTSGALMEEPEVRSVAVSGLSGSVLISEGHCGTFALDGRHFARWIRSGSSWKLVLDRVVAGSARTLTVVDDESSVLATAPVPGYVVEFSTDSRFLSYLVDNKATLRDLESGRSATLPPGLDFVGASNFLYGVRAGYVVRAPFSFETEFRLTGEVESLFHVGRGLILGVRGDTVYTGARELRDHTVIEWWQNFESTLEN